MRIALPPSLDKTRHPVHDEVAHARALTPEQRLHLVALVCRAARHALNTHPKRHRVQQLRDPVPASTREALRRLAAER